MSDFRVTFCAVSLALTSCASVSGGVSSSVPAAASSDTAYSPVVRKWHRSESVYSMFQKRIEVNAVMLTSEFRSAYLERAGRIWGEGQEAFDSSIGSRVGFLVSFYTPDKQYDYLDDKRIWALSLNYGGTKVSNPEIRALSDKVVLDPFFPFINQWSHEYLVAFDPALGSSLPQSVSLALKSALANIELEWR